MLKNIKPRERKIDSWYELQFNSNDGWGFTFPCEADGTVKPMTKQAEENFRWCQEHLEEFDEPGVVTTIKAEYTEPASGDCICGERVILEDQYYGACECPKCGRWYNLFGQELLHPSLWETDPSEEEYY